MEPALAFPLLAALIGVALLFDFLNGLHDAANSIATVVSTRVLRPHVAVAWAAFFNFIAFLFFGLHVAETVGKGIVDANVIDPTVIFGALMGAISWNVITWVLGIPSSSSHALIGGLIGAGTAKAGLAAIVWSGVTKTAVAIVLSPTIGMFVALLLVLVTSWAFARVNARFADRVFRRLQLISAALYSLGHGGNDAQKTMGVIAVLLFSQGMLGDEFYVPFWVVITCQLAMGLGTLMGGWRIVHTMGSKITRLSPQQGACAEMGWIFAPHAQGQGYAFEAVTAALHWADEALAGREIPAIIDPGNSASIHLAERAGFGCREEAVYRGAPILLFRRQNRRVAP